MNVMNEIQNINPDQEDFKSHALPLARIKKIMKSEEEILNDAPNAPNSRFMISAEAPIMFAKACEIFIAELTTRSWGHTEENKRRTLQRNDISVAVSKTDTFDFLIDIVPREEIKAGEEPVQRPINAASPLGAQQQQDPNVMYQQMQLAQAQQMQAQMAQMDPTQQMQYMQMIAAQQQQPYAQMVMYQQQQQQMAQMQAMQAQQAGHMGEMEAAMHGNEENQNLNVMQHPDMNKDLQNYSAEQQQMMMYQQVTLKT
uniref:Core Histone H2A/H2B/H3 domain-containing protein n=2 Tax=Phaeomonas parva TaxID=124430 RepID=A0A7S1TX41_9STRA|mmetsp:Transcript_22007/g.67553  ORF Transcript_22007/g.67553 Transcript_22007/m.67553 type:complete len:256 (+) Transcript_22007:2-769(+)